MKFTIKNFKYSILIILINNVSLLYCQILNTDTIVPSNFKKELLVSYNNYFFEENPTNKIVLIDYYKKDNSTYFRYCLSNSVYEILSLKKPTYYFLDSTNIIYVYTKDWHKEIDTLYFEEIFYKTLGVLDMPYSTKIYWENENIIFNDMFLENEIIFCDVPIKEYEIKNGKIEKIKLFNKMFYPDLALKEVLYFYNLKPDKLNRIKCPNSKDSLPYIKIYKESDSWYCLRENCEFKYGMIIEFIMKYENITRKEAIEKVKQLCLEKREKE